MPELPEVETIRRGLERRLVGRTVESVEWSHAKFRSSTPHDLAELSGHRFGSVGRHGKFLLNRMDDGATLLVHLGMTGKLLFEPRAAAERKHTHLSLRLDDGTDLRFSDPRRFGVVKLYGAGEHVADLDGYGLDALDPEFDPTHLRRILSASRAPLKAFLLDQRKLAGVGNIYASEALWRAGLSPRRAARRVAATSVALLHESVVDVLRDALDDGGTSFNDYVDHIGQPGKFVAKLAVFQREGKPCPRCKAKVRRIVQSGRSTFYCPACQR